MKIMYFFYLGKLSIEMGHPKEEMQPIEMDRIEYRVYNCVDCW